MSMVESKPISFEGEKLTFFYPNRECVQFQQMRDTKTFCELNLLEKIRSLKIGGTYLDIGGNIGNHAIFFSRFCNCDKIISFEPTPRFFRCLEENVKNNDKDGKISIVKAAVHDKVGRGKMKNGGGGEENEILVPGDQVDVIMVKKSDYPDKIGLIKVDTEGTELYALKGCETVIEEDHPTVVVECVTIRRFRECYYYLRKFGYQSNAMSYTETAPTFVFVPKEENYKLYEIKIPDKY